MEYKGLQSTPEDKKNSIRVSLRGILFLILIMVGIRVLIALASGAGWIQTEEKKEADSMEEIIEYNKQFKIEEKNAVNDGIASLPLMVYVDAVDYRDGILTVHVDNQSGFHAALKQIYRLELQEGEQWTELSPVAESGSAIGKKADQNDVEMLELEDLESQELEIDLNQFGKLTEGSYKLSIDDWSTEFALVR